jgi:hypothetical protein
VPPEVTAGVFIAEELLNRGAVDITQDTLFHFLVRSRDDNWWTHWALDAMELADRAEDARMVSNKWPLNIVKTGIVFSIGPAQITPRTVLHACSYFKETEVDPENETVG